MRQFHQLYPNIRNPYEIMHRLPEHHLGEEEHLAKLALKQGELYESFAISRSSSLVVVRHHSSSLVITGSMMQFPKKLHSTKFDYFHPPEG